MICLRAWKSREIELLRLLGFAQGGHGRGVWNGDRARECLDGVQTCAYEQADGFGFSAAQTMKIFMVFVTFTSMRMLIRLDLDMGAAFLMRPIVRHQAYKSVTIGGRSSGIAPLRRLCGTRTSHEEIFRTP